MIFPLWAFFGLCLSMLSATEMLLQERFKVNGAALAFWNKIVIAVAMTPFVIYHGFPHEINFYIFMGLSAVIFAISDVIYFSGVSEAGAGTISRLLPTSVIFSFLLWFMVDPSSFHAYLQKPSIAAAIFLVLCLWVYFATHLRKCAISMKAARTVWFCIFAAVVGTLLEKGAVNSTDIKYGTYGFPFVQAVMMLAIWSVFFYVRKPVTMSVLLSREVWPYSLLIGGVNSVSMVMASLSFYHVDNPAYTTAMMFLNSFFILLAYAVMGRKNDGNVIAGIGMVMCTAVLVILKARI